MTRIPEPREIDTLQAISEIEKSGWSLMETIDPRACLDAGWIVGVDGSHRLTDAGRAMLRTYGRRSRDDDTPHAPTPAA